MKKANTLKQALYSSICVAGLLIFSSFCSADDNNYWNESPKKSLYDSGGAGYISPRASIGRFSDDDFTNYANAGLAFGYDIDQRQSIELDFALANVEPDKDGAITSLFRDDPQILSAAINYRYFFTPRHEFPGVYMTFGLAYNGIFWDYKNGVTDPEGKSITSDDIDGTEFSAGLGMTFISTKYADFRAEIVPSVVLWDDTTDNDLDHNFNPSKLVKLRFMVDFYIPEQNFGIYAPAQSW